MAIHSILKRYSGSDWVPVHLQSAADIIIRLNGHTVESDLSNFLPEATGTTSAPASTSLGKLYTDNNGKVYSSDADGRPVAQATEQYVQDNKYVLPSIEQSDTTSTSQPEVGGSITVIDSVTRDSNGRVTGINLKTVTLPAQETITGNAGTATKLANGANIAITGAARAEQQNFDGSTDINLNVTSLDADALDAPVSAEKGGTGLGSLPAGEVLVGNGTSPITSKVIDSTPTAESENLITSGAVAAALEGKSSTITGAASTVVSADLAKQKVVVSDDAGKLAASSVTTEELNSLSGVTGLVQSQIDSKAPTDSPALTGNPTAPTKDVGDDSTSIATTAFVVAAVNNLLNTKNAFRLVGSLDPTSQALPAGEAGDVYRITADGTINGLVVHENDTVTCAIDSTAAETPDNWYVTHTNHNGSVFGPASSVDSHVVVFDGSSGNRIKDSGFTIGKSVPDDAVFTDTVYTHPASGVAASTYGPNSDTSPSYGGTIVVPEFTVDANGHITVANNRTITFPTAQTDITGNAATATKLQTVRTITFSGGATGSFSFDGSDNVSCELTVSSGGGSSYVQSSSQPAADAQSEGDFWEYPLS